MRKKLIFFCTIPVVFLTFVGCSKVKQDENNIILGDIELNDGTIELGEIEEFENSQMDGVINYEEQLQKPEETESVKDSTTETNSKTEEKSEETKTEETKESFEKETNKKEETKESTEESKEKVFKSEELKDKKPEEIYEWYLLNVKTLDYEAEENQKFIEDYYSFVDKKYNTEAEFADFFFDKAQNDSKFDFYFIQNPKDEIREETTQTNNDETKE